MTRKCYRCGDGGHLKRDCPRNRLHVVPAPAPEVSDPADLSHQPRINQDPDLSSAHAYWDTTAPLVSIEEAWWGRETGDPGGDRPGDTAAGGGGPAGGGVQGRAGSALMADSYDWQMARRISRLAAHAPGRGLPRWELIAGLGDAARFDLWVRLAYARGWVDCVRDYVVAPTLGPGAAPVMLGGYADTPASSRVPHGPPGVPPTSRPGGSPRGEPLFS